MSDRLHFDRTTMPAANESDGKTPESSGVQCIEYLERTKDRASSDNSKHPMERSTNDDDGKSNRSQGALDSQEVVPRDPKQDPQTCRQPEQDQEKTMPSETKDGQADTQSLNVANGTGNGAG